MEYGMMHELEKVATPGDRESLSKSLLNLSKIDADFSGENGVDYLWETVWKANGYANQTFWEDAGEPELKYKSNAEYVVDILNKEDIEDDKQFVEHFLTEWLCNESYYPEWSYIVLRDLNDNVTAISIAALTL